MPRLALTLGLGLILIGLVPPAPATAQTPRTWQDRTFVDTGRAFINPERGFYAPRMTHDLWGLDGLRPKGISLVLLEVDLKGFRDQEIAPGKLEEIRGGLVAVRRAGLKAIVRAAYGYTDADYRVDPKDMALIQRHIRQIGDILRAESDVVFAVQAGFLGPWGEWHGSNWGDPPSKDARKAVLFGLLDSIPAPIPVQIRRPMFVRDIFADEPGGATLDATRAFDGSRLARTGWHNDALLSTRDDMGTYAQRGWDRERELNWAAVHGRFTPFGGETVPASAKMPVGQVVRELELLHATYLNSAYHRKTLEGWKAAKVDRESAFDLIARRLGYRLKAERLRVAGPGRAGGRLPVELTIRNVGFAPPMLPRGVVLSLSRGNRSERLTLKDADPRRWAPESGPITLKAEIPIPADAEPGRWRLAIQLPDPSPRLRNDPRYTIRLAGDGLLFQETDGANVLASDIEIR